MTNCLRNALPESREPRHRSKATFTFPFLPFRVVIPTRQPRSNASLPPSLSPSILLLPTPLPSFETYPPGISLKIFLYLRTSILYRFEKERDAKWKERGRGERNRPAESTSAVVALDPLRTRNAVAAIESIGLRKRRVAKRGRNPRPRLQAGSRLRPAVLEIGRAVWKRCV